MLEQLNEIAVEKPRKIFGRLYWGVEEEEIAMQIAKIRASLPVELKQAEQRVRESERILVSAREDASQAVESARREAERALEEAKANAQKILEEARLQQQRMVSESEILKLAKAQAEEIRNSADRESTQMRRAAEKYAYDVLSQLEGVLGKAVAIVERGKQDLERPAPQPVAAVEARDRVRG
ncbi:MAG: hypothetical protein SNJ76_02655 [Fimbriimonadaceae bacterium]